MARENDPRANAAGACRCIPLSWKDHLQTIRRDREAVLVIYMMIAYVETL